MYNDYLNLLSLTKFWFYLFIYLFIVVVEITIMKTNKIRHFVCGVLVTYGLVVTCGNIGCFNCLDSIALKNAGTRNVFAAPGKGGVGELRALCIKSFDVGDGNILKLKLISVNGIECDNEDEISVKRGDIFLFELSIE